VPIGAQEVTATPHRAHPTPLECGGDGHAALLCPSYAPAGFPLPRDGRAHPFILHPFPVPRSLIPYFPSM